MNIKWVFSFDEGDPNNVSLLGGKGAGLVSMTQKLSIPIPPGFIITTEACNAYLRSKNLPNGLWQAVLDAIQELERKTSKKFGGVGNPLLVSVRSGAPRSMPGMLETVLNVGLTQEIVSSSSKQDSQFVIDSYSKLIHKYTEVIYGIELNEQSINPNRIEGLLAEFRKTTGNDFPDDPYTQLRNSITAVFNSWLSPKAVEYRHIEQVPDSLGTAAVVQAMVFGNKGNDSGTGVVFSRDPGNGKRQFFGEYLLNAQGEDLVAGIRTPREINGLSNDMPAIYTQIKDISRQLEDFFHDVQDIEFTFEKGELWILQTRSAKRTPFAAIKIAVDMATEGTISKLEGAKRISPQLISKVFSPQFEEDPKAQILAIGIGSSPGAAVGKTALSREKVKESTDKGEHVIFVRENTSPDDVPVMPTVDGILTQHGGATSHAAVVARGIGRPCVVGCESLNINLQDRLISIKQTLIHEGEFISIDGDAGTVFSGKRKLINIDKSKFTEFNTLLSWVDELNAVEILPIASTGVDVAFALQENMSKIGLLRTEWMFNDMEFRAALREGLISLSNQKRADGLRFLEDLQAKEFESIFRSLRTGEISIRLLSSPIEDFLPVMESLSTELTELKWSEGWNTQVGNREQTLRQISTLKQVNPRFGNRGARALLTMPKLFSTQVRALFKGLCSARKTQKNSPKVTVLIPDVISANEVAEALKFVEIIAQEVVSETKQKFVYQTGAILANPRAMLVSDQIAELVNCIYIETADLTESVYSFSREDETRFMPQYLTKKIIGFSPLDELDEDAVGQLIQTTIRKNKAVTPDKPIIIYGPHCSQRSIDFFGRIGVDGFCADMSKVMEMKFSFVHTKREI